MSVPARAFRQSSIIASLALVGAGCTDPLTEEPPLTGEPAWTIEHIEDQASPVERPARLRFHEDGRLTGQAPCNVLMGRYSRSGQELAINQVTTTRMACSPAVMERERRFLGLLTRVEWFRIGLDEHLELVTEEGVTLQGRRGE